MKPDLIKTETMIRKLKKMGYEIKHTDAVGWWIDGACGYGVACYYTTLRQACIVALKRIEKAKKELNTKHTGIPSWFITKRIRSIR